MNPTRTVGLEEITVTKSVNGHVNGADATSDDAVFRELRVLRRREAVLRDFVETSTIGLHWVDADGIIVWANQAELDLLGYTPDQYIGRNIADFHADEAVINEILACLSRGEILRDYPARLRHCDGSIRHVLINSSVLFEDGKFIHTRCFTRDVTALKLEQETRQEQERIDVFAAQIGKCLIEISSLSDMLRHCTATIVDHLGAAFARVWTFQEDENVLKLQASSGLYTHLDGAHARIPVGSFKIGRIAAQRRPHLTNQVIGDPNVPEQDWARKEGMVGFAGYPLLIEDRLVGVIGMFSRHALSEITLRAMARVANQIAVDIERKKAEESLRESQARLAAELADTKLLQEISAQLIEEGHEDALYAKIVDATASIMGSDFATMQMLYPKRGPKGELRLLASRGLPPEGAKIWEWVRSDTDSTCGQALRAGKRAIAANIEECDFLAGTVGVAALLDAGIRAAQSTPLYSRSGRMLGMISSHWRQPHTPTERDLRLLDILARQAADLIERKQAEQALRESERRLHEIFEALPAAVYTTDADGRITFFNQAAAEFSGRVPQLGNDSWCVTWKMYNTDGTPLPHDQCPMAVALREKRCVRGCEAVAERPDGERRVFEPYPTPLFDASGGLSGAVNMLVDITARKRAEEKLRASEDCFRAIVETTPECIKVVAADGTLRLMNQAGLAMVGAGAPDDVTGRSVYDLIAPEDRAMFRSFNERVCDGGKASLEFDIVGLKGTRRRMETHAVPLRQSDGSIAQLGITSDITERRNAEETRLLLGAIVDSSDDAIISQDLDGQITSWNRGAAQLYGYTEAEAVGKSIMILVPEARQQEESEILARLSRGERVDHLDTLRLRKDGALLNVSLTISPLKNQLGEIIGVSKIARDITNQKRAEAELRRANKDLEQFAYSASHDLQEPLRTIKIYSQLLSGHLGSVAEGETAEFLNFLTKAATRMEVLLRDLMAYVQVIKLDAQAPEADTNEIMEEVLANLGGAIRESGAAVTCDRLPLVRAHRAHLSQLFQNLIGNAIKYRSVDRTPIVHIDAEHQDAFWVFSVRDNGIGIQPEFKEQIFGLFSRLHNADRYPGTGIGLALCQRIVERYHGRIWVDSEPGRGSEFRFTLPV